MTETGMRNGKSTEYGICLLCGAAFLAVLVCSLRMMYVIHDDVYIRNIAAGAVSGQPDPHLIYMHSALGAVLAGLYRVLPGVDWYGTGLTLLACGCFLAVLWRLLSMGFGKVRVLVFWMPGVMCAGFYYLVLFQYTVTAGIAGATAVFLFCAGEKEGKRQPMELAGIAFLLVLTYLIRQETFLIVFPVFACTVAYEWLEKRKLRHVVLLAGMVGVIGCFYFVEKAAYLDPQWSEYMRYNEARSEVFDYYGVPPYAGNEAFYQSIGMEEYQVINLERYNVYLVEDLDADKMETIAAYAKERYTAEHSVSDRVKAGLKNRFLGSSGGRESPGELDLRCDCHGSLSFVHPQ